jgi:hypothetical protein
MGVTKIWKLISERSGNSSVDRPTLQNSGKKSAKPRSGKDLELIWKRKNRQIAKNT